MKRTLPILLTLIASVAFLAGCGATPAPVTPAPPPQTALPTQKPPAATAAPTLKPTTAPPTVAATNVPGGYNLTILHTNDVKGYVEPCG